MVSVHRVVNLVNGNLLSIQFLTLILEVVDVFVLAYQISYLCGKPLKYFALLLIDETVCEHVT